MWCWLHWVVTSLLKLVLLLFQVLRVWCGPMTSLTISYGQPWRWSQVALTMAAIAAALEIIPTSPCARPRHKVEEPIRGLKEDLRGTSVEQFWKRNQPHQLRWVVNQTHRSFTNKSLSGHGSCGILWILHRNLNKNIHLYLGFFVSISAAVVHVIFSMSWHVCLLPAKVGLPTARPVKLVKQR